MHINQQKRLLAKGWNKYEIDHAIKVFHSSKQKTKHVILKKELHLFAFSLFIVVLFLASIIGLFYMIPFFILFSKTIMLILAIIFGLAFGLAFSYIIAEIEHLERRHHLFMLSFLPCLIFFNAIIMLRFSSKIAYLYKINYSFDIIVLLFSACFMLPYLWFYLTKRL